ncbi:hypothetical protein C8N37_102491 [Sphingobacterium faecium]|nr:hypothetical protein C8N37_102491 [Sphingobacterium faecium]
MLRLLRAMFLLLLIVQLFLLFSMDDSYRELVYIGQLIYVFIPLWAFVAPKNRKFLKKSFQIYVIFCGLYYVFFALVLMAKHVQITPYFGANLLVKSILLMIGLVSIYQYKNWSRLFFSYINQRNLKM